MQKIGAISGTYADSDSEWTNGNVANGVTPTTLDAGWLNTIQRELVNIVETAGLTLSSSDDTQVLQAIRLLAATNGYATDTGTANAYVVTYSPAVTALTDGMCLRFKAITANTGASTLAVNELTATPIIGLGLSVLQGGEIIAGSECIVIYSKSLASFVLVSSSGGALQVAAGTQTNHAINLGQFSYTHSSSSSSGYRKEPDGRIHMWGYCITSSLPTVSGGSWSVTLPTAFPKYMESAQATLAMGAAVSGSAVSVMDVGTPFTGTTDNMLPKASASSISGYVFNNYGASTKMFIRWDAWGY